MEQPKSIIKNWKDFPHTAQQLSVVKEAALQYGLGAVGPNNLSLCGYGLLKWKLGWKAMDALEPCSIRMGSIFNNYETREQDLTEIQQWLAPARGN